MKLLVIGLLTGIGSIASAATLNQALCAPTGAFGLGGTPYGTTVVTTCPSFTSVYVTQFGVAPGPGVTITGVTLTYQGTISFGTANGTNTVNFSYDPADTGTSTWTNDPSDFDVSCNSSGTPCVGGPGIATSVANTPTNANFLTNTTTVSMDALNTVGTVQSADARTLVTYTYEDSSIPEPSTFALLGLGLVGTAIVARRRRA